MNFSTQQVNIFDAIKTGSGDLVIDANAGTGKTTTMIGSLPYFKASDVILLSSFANKNVGDFKAKLALVPKGQIVARVEPKTLNALGFQFLNYNWKGLVRDAKRHIRIARTACGLKAPDHLVIGVKKLAELAKGSAPFGNVQDLVNLAWDFNLFSEEIEDDGVTVQDFARFALKAMDLSCERDGTWDFEDQVFVPLKNGWLRAWYTVVIIDEAQDMNKAQLMLARKVLKRGGRFIAVGDPRQAIYTFRGADSGSMDRMKEALGNAGSLSLSVTYRCCKAVVRLAQKFVPSYEAFEGNPEGTVDSCKVKELIELAKPGESAIISRKNAPLMGLCLRFLKAEIPAYVEGRSVGEDLDKLVEKLVGKRNSIPEFLTKLKGWEEKQINRLKAANGGELDEDDHKAQEIHDKADCLRALASDLVSVAELRARLKNLFANSEHDQDRAKSSVVLSSIHKAKGLEFPRVFGLDWTLRRGTGNIEEENLEYVLNTRAIGHYTFVFE